MNEALVVTAIVFSSLFVLTAAAVIVALWRIFKRAGEKSWKVFIPVYNILVANRIAGMSQIWFITDLAVSALGIALQIFDFIPDWIDISFRIIALLFSLIAFFVFSRKLCKCFDKGLAFQLGVFLVPAVFMLILAFGKADYHEPEPSIAKAKTVDRTVLDRSIRRLESNLYTLGSGVFVFSIWIFVKFFLSVFMSYNSLIPEGDDISDSSIIIIMTIVMAILGAINTAFFLLFSYIGLSARSEGTGKKKSPVYIVFSCLLMFFLLVAVSAEMLAMGFIFDDLFSGVTTLIIDGTSFALVFDLTISAIRLRKLKKIMAAGGDTDES